MLMQKYYFGWIDDLGAVLFPRICPCCGNSLLKGEDILCLLCTYRLPYTRYHLLQYSPVSQKFWGRLPVTGAFAYLFFRKGNATQALLHALKYHNRQDIGEKLGKMFGKELADSGSCPAEVIIPLPLHISKQRDTPRCRLPPFLRFVALKRTFISAM